MSALDFFSGLVAGQKSGKPRGIGSVCSAHRDVLDAAFLQASRDGLPVLVESTVNQVNQLGGYTGMTPEAFHRFVLAAADDMDFPPDRLILGGDHLGPYPWRKERAESAMEKARELVTASVLAGYAKIHLDASMPLGGDHADRNGGLDPRTIADREGKLAAAAEKAFREGSGAFPRRSPPVYVIGTEVPAPGGIVSEGHVSVTRAEDFRETVSLCKETFHKQRLQDAWTRVFAVWRSRAWNTGTGKSTRTIGPGQRNFARQRARSRASSWRAIPRITKKRNICGSSWRMELQS